MLRRTAIVLALALLFTPGEGASQTTFFVRAQSPPEVRAGEWWGLLADVSPSNCGNIIVSVDMSPMGRSADVRIGRDTTCSDAYPFTYGGRLGLRAPQGRFTLTLTAWDEAGRRAQTAVTFTVLPPVDVDADELPDRWEQSFGLSTSVVDGAVGVDGRDGDPDQDRRTNAQEYADGTHPRGFFTSYFAEGADDLGVRFWTWLSGFVPGTEPANVLVRHLREDGVLEGQGAYCPPMAYRVEAGRWDYLRESLCLPLEGAYGTVVESDLPVLAEREMTLVGDGANSGGAHLETAADGPRYRWFLAEGTTYPGFNLYYLIVNPNPVMTYVWVKYFLPGGAPPIVKRYEMLAQSRRTIWVNGEDPRLVNTDVSALVGTNQSDFFPPPGLGGDDLPPPAFPPVIVERSLYLERTGRRLGGATSSRGVESPALTWYMAEGATGPYFDAFILMLNPELRDAQVRITYMLPDGTSVVREHDVPHDSRVTIWVDAEEARLADTAFAARVDSLNGVPIVVERSMWWPGPTSATWYEGHSSAAVAEPALRWAVTNGPYWSNDHYVLIANFEDRPVTIQLTALGYPDLFIVPFTIPARTRFNLRPYIDLPTSHHIDVLTIESIGFAPVPIVVERSTYTYDRLTWGRGTNAVAFRLP